MGQTELTLRPFLWRTRRLFPDKELVTRTGDGTFRYTYAEYADRVARLANALDAAGIGDGDAVGTFCWNHHRHFETYFGVPDVGAKLHTVNVRLPEEHVRYLVTDARDRLLFVDPDLVGRLEGLVESGAFETVERFVVMDDAVPDTTLSPTVDYESFIAGHPTEYEGPPLSEDQPAAMCYTSGTTGKPKGVEYTHKMLWTQIMTTLTPEGFGFDESDVVLQTVPMFHINGWGWPYEAAALGAKQVFPGRSPDAATLCELIEGEGVTFTGGVPTVWLDVLDYLDDHDADLSSLETVHNGGSSPPASLIRRFEEDYGVRYQCSSGMTEVTSLATTARAKSKMADWDDERRFEKQRKAGLILPGMEFKVVDEDGEEVPWDGESTGELYYRGPWVIDGYYQRPDADAENFEDGWLKTGDIVTVDGEGYIDIVDRKKHMIKSGGEWISSAEVENAIMDHEDVVEASVVGVPHERWQERPLAVVVPARDRDEDEMIGELEALLGDRYPSWWLPDAFEFVESIPKTATGKFDKKRLEDEYADYAIGE